MANANPAQRAPKGKPVEQEKKEPKIEFYGEGAEKVKFEKDPKASLIRVYASGMVLIDY